MAWELLLLVELCLSCFGRNKLTSSAGGQACIVLMLSLTRFDGINAAYGRALADMLLQAVARRIRRVVGSDLPERMLAARMAGAEFAVAHAGPVKLADVVLLAERLGEAFDRPFLVTGNVIHLATRMGIAVGERDLDGADTLLRRASAALAQAKTGDPHSYEIFMGKGPEELLGRGHNCLLLRYPRSTEYYWVLTGPDGPQKMLVKGSFDADDSGLLLEWARAGAGIVNRPRFEVAADLAAGRLVELLPRHAPPPARFGLLYPHSRMRNPKLKVFVDFAVREAKKAHQRLLSGDAA